MIKKMVLSLFVFAVLIGAAYSSPIDLLNSYVRVDGAAGVIIKIIKKEDKKFCYVLTADHVVRDIVDDKENIDKTIDLIAYKINEDGEVDTIINFVGKVLEAVGIEADFAIVEAELPEGMEAVKINFDKITLGQDILTLGSPNDSPYWFSKGNICQIRPRRLEHKYRRIGHNAGIWYGSSGGPIFNEKEELIGLSVAMSASCDEREIEIPHLCWGVPLNLIQDKLGEEKFNSYFK